MTTRHAHNVFSIFALLALIVFCCFTDQDKALASASGFSVSAVQGNITNGKLNVSKGDKVDLIVNANGSAITAKSAKYKSSNKRVATVSRSGRIKAKKKGSAVITVSYKGAVSKVKVRVKTSKITLYNSTNGFNLSLNTAQMRPSSFRLKVKYKNKKTVKTPKVTFSSSNPAVATVDNKGVVTLKAAGTVTITAKYKKKTGRCTICVRNKTIKRHTVYSTPAGVPASYGSGTQGSYGTNDSSGTQTTPGSQTAPGTYDPFAPSTPETNYVKETEQKYTYKLEIVNPTPVFSGYECILHVITDNPNYYDPDSRTSTAKICICPEGGQQTILGRLPFHDIKFIESNRVSDGYMYSITFNEPGNHTISLKEYYSKYKGNGWSVNDLEYDYDVDTDAQITVNVKDAAASEEAFYTRMLKEHRGATDRETLENLTVYFRKNFKYQSYYVNSGKYTKLNLLANYGPWWITFKDITCYDSTAIMINFANRLGYPAKEINPNLRGMDHRLAWVYFDPSKVNEPGFNESYMGSYDACPIGMNNNYTYDTFKYLYS